MLMATTSEAGELYITGYIEPNMAARADGGNPKSGIGIFQPIKLSDDFTASIRAEAMLDGRDRDGQKHPVSIRYTVRLRYTYEPLFIEAERFAWNPITHTKRLPYGMKETIGGGDTMSSYAIRMGIKW
jgi:hypothetical protein